VTLVEVEAKRPSAVCLGCGRTVPVNGRGLLVTHDFHPNLRRICQSGGTPAPKVP
jgi:hypothetical protein